MRRFLLVLLVLGAALSGCAAKRTPEPTPAPPPVAPTPQPAPLPAPPQPPAEPAVYRQLFPGGVRFGPYHSVNNLQWVGNDHVYATTRLSGSEKLELFSRQDGDPPSTLLQAPPNQMFYLNLPVLNGQAVLYSGLEPGQWLKPAVGAARQVAEGSQWQVSPDRTRLVSYKKGGEARFVDLRTGQSHRLPAETFYGSNVWDAWSPDGTRYLFQARRTDPVPGFTFLDGAGQPLSTWQEPGYYSLWAAWAPDSRQLAFYSVPMATVYRRHPDAWAEPQLAPRLGVLDVATGKARYFTADGLLVGGAVPLWAPDSSRVAVLCGGLNTEGEQARLGAPLVCVADLASGQLRPVSPPLPAEGIAFLESWAPDAQGVIYRSHADSSSNGEYHLAQVGGGPPLALPGRAVWISAERMAIVGGGVTSPMTLTLHDRQGKLLKELASARDIAWVTLSPDGTQLLFATSNLRNAADPPSAYVVIVRAGE